jgi:predicted metal-dependent enzyme (double-stranded beta helix superfamily)
MPLDNATLSAAHARATACNTFMRQVQLIIAKEGVTPSALHALKNKLVTLAKRPELFPVDDFPMPEAQGRNHVIAVADNDGPGLYLTIGLPAKEAAPHDHGIWCVNAAISGQERHILWRRADDGAKPGHATLAKVGEVLVEPGRGFAMADHDIHSTEVVGDVPAIGLALYGYALTRFPSVVWYHPEFSSLRPMPSRRGAGAA